MLKAEASPSARKRTLSSCSLKVSSPAAHKAASPASQYERIEANIGEGTYGKIHKARDVRTGKVVAIKKFKVSAADRDVGGIGFTALREIKVMQAVRHPNVMGCLDVFADGLSINMVMEFMDGDLKKIVEDRRIVLEETHVKCLAQQLVDGIAALHREWFVHRDLTPTNVLLSYASGVARITDFGLTRTLGHGERPLTPMCTTLWYRPPEMLYGAKFYGTSVDLWSLGAVIAEMFLRKPLFPGRGEFDMLGKIFEKRGTPSESVWRDVSALPTFLSFSQHVEEPMATTLPTASAAALDLVDGMLRLDPKQRPTAEQALQHEFFSRAPACEPYELPFVHHDVASIHHAP